MARTRVATPTRVVGGATSHSEQAAIRPETRAALDLIASGHFSPGEPGVFQPILDVLLAQGDFYLHPADLHSYREAHARLGRFYRNPEAWARAAVLNVASSGPFSIDRTAQYAAEIWNVVPCPTEESVKVAEGAEHPLDAVGATVNRTQA